MRQRGTLFWLGLGVALLVVGYLFGSRSSTGEPLDPDGTDGIGTRALMLFLEEYGVEVARDAVVPEPGDPSVDVALVLTDQLDAAAWDSLERWVEEGGTVVQIGSGSPLAPEGVHRVSTDNVLPSGVCDLPELDGLALEATTFQLLATDAASAHCFGDDHHAMVHVAERGAGRVVSLGTAVVLTNQYLDQGDNAVLAAALLVPDGPTGTVAVLYRPIVSPGSGNLLDAVPGGVRWAGIQLLVAFVVLLWWQGRRFGRPVAEPQPVELPGSLLVRATAELQRRARSHRRAGEVLRRHTIRRVAAHLAAPADTPPRSLVEELVQRTPVERSTAETALLDGPVDGAAALAALVAAIDRIGAAIDGSRPTADASPVPPPGPGADPADPARPEPDGSAPDDQNVPTGAAR